jgi:hypothetical protein
MSPLSPAVARRRGNFFLFSREGLVPLLFCPEREGEKRDFCRCFLSKKGRYGKIVANASKRTVKT